MIPDMLFKRISRIPLRLGRKYGTTDQQNAYLGKGDGTGTILATDAPYPRSVYCHQDVQTSGRTIFTAVLTAGCGIPYENNPALEFYPVIVGYTANSNILRVLPNVDLASGSAGGGLTPSELKEAGTIYVDTNRLLPLFINPDTGMNIVVNATNYFHPDRGVWVVFGGDVITLTAPSSGYHQLQVICLDSETNALTVVSSTAVLGSSKDDFDFTTITGLTIPDHYLLCGCVHVVGAVTSLTETDIYRNVDPRALWLPGGAYGRVYRGSLQTTNATTSTLLSFVQATNTGITVSGVVGGLRDDASEFIGGTFVATARRASGNIVLVGTPTIVIAEDSSGTPSFAVDVDTGTQTLRVRVTGEASKTFNWRVHCQAVKIA